MKATKRFLFGVVSSALFAVGFARVANHLDPLSLGLRGVDMAATGAAPSCATECWVAAN